MVIIAPPLCLAASIAFLVGRWQPVVAVAVVLWGALVVALFALAAGPRRPSDPRWPWLSFQSPARCPAPGLVVSKVAFLRAEMSRPRELPRADGALPDTRRVFASWRVRGGRDGGSRFACGPLARWSQLFRFCHGSRADVERWASYLVVSMVAGSAIAGPILRSRVNAMTNRRLSLAQAVVSAFGALAPVQAAIAMITLTQQGNDEILFLSAVMLGIGVAAICVQALSENSAGD